MPALVRAAITAALVFAPIAEAQTMFLVPTGATEVRHTALQPGVYEQDSFVLLEPYPSTAALEHYRRVLQGWTPCPRSGATWQTFGVGTGAEPRYRHQLMQHWVNATNTAAVTITLLYTSIGKQPQGAPDNSQQQVVVLRLVSFDAKSELSQIGVKCE